MTTPDSPAGSRSKTQRTCWPSTAQLPAASSVTPAVMAPTPAGTVSLMCTATASDGPSLVTVSCQLTLRPGTTVAGPVFSSLRSALGASGVVSPRLLVPDGCSVVVKVADAVLPTSPVASAATRTGTVTVTDCPAGRVPTSQRTAPSAATSAQLPMEAVGAPAAVSCAGSGSLTAPAGRPTGRCW